MYLCVCRGCASPVCASRESVFACVWRVFVFVFGRVAVRACMRLCVWAARARHTVGRGVIDANGCGLTGCATCVYVCAVRARKRRASKKD